jgi:hypothetical protein
MKMLRERSWTLNIHTTLASFSFNFDHMAYVLILNENESFNVIENQ